MQKQTSQRTRAYRRTSLVFTLCFVAFMMIVNAVLFALSNRYEWYFYTAEHYEHTIGTATDALFAEEDTPVEILFCMSEEELESDVMLRLVYRTAKQLEEKHDFLTVKNVNIYLNPKEVSPYREVLDAEGNVIRTNTIDTYSVIFVSEDRFRVETLSTFFVLNESQVITAYHGEEMMASFVSWVQKETHPIACFTYTHGENYDALLSFYDVLTASGYDVRGLDLSLETVPEDVSLIIMSNPLYDIERAAEGSGIVSETEKLEAFLARGGSLYVSIDPYAKASLPQLRRLLSEWGMEPTSAILSDMEQAITFDGYTLTASYAPSAVGQRVQARVHAFNDSYVVFRDCAPILLQEGSGAHPVLTTSATAKAYQDGVLWRENENFVLTALSQKENADGSVGSILLTSGAFGVANDILNSNVYANRELLFAVLEELGAPQSCIGTTVLPVNNTMLEGLTVGTANRYAVCLIVILPLAVAVFGGILLLRRKNK